jgi:hypothetical protein
MATTIMETLKEALASLDAVAVGVSFKVAITVQVVDIVPGKAVRD